MIKTLGLSVVALAFSLPVCEAQVQVQIVAPEVRVQVAEEKAPEQKPVEKAADQPADKAAAEKVAAEKKAAAEKEVAARVEAEKKAAAQAKLPVVRRAGFNVKAQRDAQRNSIKNMVDGGTFKMNDLIRFGMDNGRLTAEWKGKSIAANQMRRIKIEGSDATWTLNYINQGQHGFFSLNRYDFDAADEDFWMTSLTVQTQMNFVTIHAQGGETCEVGRMYYTQQPNAVMMNMTGWENNRMRQIMTANAPDLMRLRNDHPDEFRKYLIPLLRRITCQPILRPGAGDVYRVFTQIPADPQVTCRIEALLPALVAPGADQRQKAAEQLNALGAPGVLAALRMDPATLAPEHRCRLADFVALNSRVVNDDPAQMTRDHNFLMDCLEDDDAAVRTAAKESLEKLLGKPVQVDLGGTAAKRAAAVEVLRIQVNKELKKDEPAKKPEDDKPLKPLGGGPVQIFQGGGGGGGGGLVNDVAR